MKAGMGILIGLTVAAAAPVQAAVWYTYDYDGTVLPTAADPAWKQYTGNSSYATVNASATTGLADPGYLEMSTNTATRAAYYYSDADWNVSDAFTLEFRTQIVSNDAGKNAFEFYGEGGSRRFTLSINTEGITFNGGAVTLPQGFDPTVYNIYRVTGQKSGSTWTYDLYLNDNSQSVASGTGASSSNNQLLFGDTSTTLTGGKYDLDYIRWNNTEAIAPTAVPEPASMGLLALAGGALLARRRRA